MADLGNFDASTIEPQFDAIPSGKYRAVIVASEKKKTKAGTGEYLELKWTITDGKYKNRNLWSRLNLKNPNQTAMEIGWRELSSIMRAVGVMQAQDSNELHRLPVQITVTQRDWNGQVQNEIKGYQKVPSMAEEAAQAAEAAEQKEESAGDSTPPWAKVDD